MLLLAFHFLRLYAAEFRKDVRSIHPGAQSLLQRYAFPGNVRELRNLMERAVILCDGDTLTEAEFTELRIGHAAAAGAATGGAGPVGLADLEAQAISAAMRQSGGNQAAAARTLGIGADALRYRLKKYDIQ